MYDNRFPFMIPVDGRPIPGCSELERVALVRLCDILRRRTGLHPFLNTRTGRVLLSVTTCPEGGPVAIPWKNGTTVKKYENHDIDDVVSYVNMGKMSRRDKDAISAKNKAAQEHAKTKHVERMHEERLPDVKDHLSFLDESRRGVRKTIYDQGGLQKCL